MNATRLDAPTRDAFARKLLLGTSIEVAARDPAVAGRLTEWFAPGTEAFIAFIPGSDIDGIVRVAAALHRAGFVPVPHIAARNFQTAADLDNAIVKLTDEAGVRKVLCIAGDLAVPRGPFVSALNVIKNGALERRGIRAVGIAGYPEGHHTLSADALRDALGAKLAALRAAGLDPFIVTQFCFESAPILDWLNALRGSGIDAPVQIGMAGPATIRTLLTFAMRCGLGNSLRMLLNQPQSIGPLLRDASPEGLVRDLADGLSTMRATEQVDLHLFPFGGIAKTGEWRRRMLG